MNHYAKHIGLPAKPIEAGGETYQPKEIRAILQELARLGVNQDKLIAQITPKEAEILKSLGGAGQINPRTGLLSFDDGGGGDGGGGEGGGGDAGGGDAGGGDEGGSDDGGSGSASAGEGAGADEGGGGFGGFGGGWGGYGDMGDAAGYSGPAGDAMGDAAAGAGYGSTGSTGSTGDQGGDPSGGDPSGGEPGYSGPAGDAIGDAAGAYGFGSAPAGSPSGDPTGGPIGGDPNPDLPTEDAIPTAGPLTDAIMAQISGFSPSQAQAIADVIQDAANQGVALSLADAAVMAGVMSAPGTTVSAQVTEEAPTTGPLGTASMYNTSQGLTAPSPSLEDIYGQPSVVTASYQANPEAVANAAVAEAAAQAAAQAQEQAQASQQSNFPAGDIAGTTGNMSMGTTPESANPTSDVVGTPSLPDLPVTEVPNAPSIFDIDAQTPGSGSTTGDYIGDYTGLGGDEVIRPPVDDYIPAREVVSSAPVVGGLSPDQQESILAEAVRRRRQYMLGSYEYAQGGLVDPTQPTQAFTDGAFTPGYVAAPPALTSYDSFGLDTVHASPLAPAPAASIPTLSPEPPLSMYMNKNAGSVASPVPQNPNVSASFGAGPLSQLG